MRLSDTNDVPSKAFQLMYQHTQSSSRVKCTNIPRAYRCDSGRLHKVQYSLFLVSVFHRNMRGSSFQVIEKKWEQLKGKPPETVGEHWSKVKDIIVDTSLKVLGRKPGRQREKWLSSNTFQMMEERRRFKSLRKGNPEMAKHHNYLLCMAVKRSAKKDKEAYISQCVAKSEMQGNKIRCG